ncbi:glycoside hydrolase family protein [Novispirillum itersonii]|uniref:hypothetical protein n=1 Tax=Novispirillum itersonii TaxID=189 RepID=UPI0003A1EF33|nr:hypothetical protein [Novispirillum itersonii]
MTRAPLHWEKLGRILDQNSLDLPWFKRNVMVPVPYLRRDGVLRIFLSLCDQDNVSRIGYVDVNPNNPQEILGYSRTPVLDIGVPGAFDDSGVLPASLVVDGDRLVLFYSAYQLLKKAPYAIFTGMAVSTDDGDSFTRLSGVPVLERRDDELLMRSSAVCQPDRNGFRLWYAAGAGWDSFGGKDVPRYDIQVLTSADLHRWDAVPQTAISLGRDEIGLTVPSVWREDGLYKVIYSVRHREKGYRLGYAESIDGTHFTRQDSLVGLDVSLTGWDSEMVCFANRITCGGRTYLFYCGNHYGLDGMGCAVLIPSDRRDGAENV